METSGDHSATKPRPPLVDDVVLSSLGDDCKTLHSMILSMPGHLDYLSLSQDGKAFHQDNAKKIHVLMSDVEKLFRMGWLSVSVVQVFMQ
jgi:hypothetical protein